MQFHRIFLFLQVAVVCLFAGRAWEHLFWDAPYRELLWDAAFMKGLVETFTSWTWEEYVTNPAVDKAIQNLIRVIGFIYAVCALNAAFIHRLPIKLSNWVLGIGAANLVFLSFLYLKEQFFHAGQFFEYALQFGAPLFLLIAKREGRISDRLVFWMKVAVAATFACHGLYAIGYYPRPGTFLSMTIRILGVSEEGAISFLNTAGILDFVIAAGIFLPDKWAKFVLLYAALWGLATSLARVVGNFFWEFPLESLHQWLHQTVYRFPHFLVPLALALHAHLKSRYEAFYQNSLKSQASPPEA